MKLLFDQNLSASLVELLRTEFPDSSHLRLLNLADVADSTVWDYAAREGFIIVSKDVDFQQRALLYGGPPKVAWEIVRRHKSRRFYGRDFTRLRCLRRTRRPRSWRCRNGAVLRVTS